MNIREIANIIAESEYDDLEDEDSFLDMDNLPSERAGGNDE